MARPWRRGCGVRCPPYIKVVVLLCIQLPALSPPLAHQHARQTEPCSRQALIIVTTVHNSHVANLTSHHLATLGAHIRPHHHARWVSIMHPPAHSTHRLRLRPRAPTSLSVSTKLITVPMAVNALNANFVWSRSAQKRRCELRLHAPERVLPDRAPSYNADAVRGVQTSYNTLSTTVRRGLIVRLVPCFRATTLVQ